MNLDDINALRVSDTATRVSSGPSGTSRRAAGNENATVLDRAELDRRIDAACGRIAPLWPLKFFVAVNPFFGLSDQSFQEASDTLARITGTGLYMPREYLRGQLASGRISQEDLRLAIDRCGSELDTEFL